VYETLLLDLAACHVCTAVCCVGWRPGSAGCVSCCAGEEHVQCRCSKQALGRAHSPLPHQVSTQCYPWPLLLRCSALSNASLLCTTAQRLKCRRAPAHSCCCQHSMWSSHGVFSSSSLVCTTAQHLRCGVAGFERCGCCFLEYSLAASLTLLGTAEGTTYCAGSSRCEQGHASLTLLGTVLLCGSPWRLA
jgi:hypothetical protein